MGRKHRGLGWVVLLGGLCVVLATLAAAPAVGGREAGAQGRPPLVVEVRQGESLWTIAREYGDPNRDIREIVWQIGRANDLDPGNLQPGDEVAIPPECLP